MNLHKWIPGSQLKKGEEESTPTYIWSMVPAAERDALLFVDRQNSTLNHLNLLTGSVEVLYRSDDIYSLRGAAFVADAKK